MKKLYLFFRDTLIIKNGWLDLSTFKGIGAVVTISLAHKKMVIMNGNKGSENKRFYYVLTLDENKRTYNPEFINLIKSIWDIKEFTEFIYHNNSYYMEYSYEDDIKKVSIEEGYYLENNKKSIYSDEEKKAIVKNYNLEIPNSDKLIERIKENYQGISKEFQKILIESVRLFGLEEINTETQKDGYVGDSYFTYEISYEYGFLYVEMVKKHSFRFKRDKKGNLYVDSNLYDSVFEYVKLWYPNF